MDHYTPNTDTTTLEEIEEGRRSLHEIKKESVNTDNGLIGAVQISYFKMFDKSDNS